jgi:1-acyl-sn-glycerol-3-phosphate acyltransferase
MGRVRLAEVEGLGQTPTPMTTNRNDPLRVRIAWAGVPRLTRVIGGMAWRLDIDHGPGFPHPPYVVAANHHSFLDPFLIAAAHRDKIRFLALHDLFGNYRWVDFSLSAFDVIPITRGTVPLGPMRTALSHLRSDGVVGIFPEGTRHSSFDPDRVRRGGAWLSVRAQVPLVPVAVSGSERVLGPDNRLHPGRLRVEVGPTLAPTGRDREAVAELNRQWSQWVASRVAGRG